MAAISTAKLTINQESLSGTSISQVGAKAIGLSLLPQKWTPRFFVISSDFFQKYEELSKHGIVDISCKQVISEGEFVELNDALIGFGLLSTSHVIVRSSSPTEGMESRGRFYSKKSEPNITAVLESCEDVFRRTILEHPASDKSATGLALILQQYIEPKAMGHLSNERRVARRKQDWLYEFESAEQPPVGRFAIKSHTVHAQPQELIAPTRKDLIRKLREVAAYIDGQGLRLHMEWVWDGQKLWIVQGDKDLEKMGPDPKSFLKTVNPIHSSYSLKCFKLWDRVSHDKWRKVKCQRDFSKAGLTCSPIWVLEDRATLENLQEGIVIPALREDLQKLLVYPIVIRTDIAKNQDGADGDEEQMLPRTDSISDAKEAEEFLMGHSRDVKLAGKGPYEFCFILHHYIPSRSSAFCLAKPLNPRVRVDSLWGLADGLLFYPYDSFQLDTDNPSKIIKRLRFKDNYLATDPVGKWKPVKAGVPWDWSSSITTEELLLISRGTKKLSGCLGECVSVMWFLGIPADTGLPPVLPWWYKHLEAIPEVEPAAPYVFGRNVVVVSNREHLAYLQARDEGDLKQLVLRLNPEPELLRDRQFLRDTAELAVKNKLPVELQGSPLQHAYYELKQFGVKVRCVDFTLRPTSPPQYFTKLVRDQIPKRIEIRGEHARISRTSAENLIAALKEKVIEEAYELFWAISNQDTREELADILELIISLAVRQGLSLRDIEKAAERKRLEKGGFEEGLILVETNEVPLIESDEKKSFIDAEDHGKIVTIRSIPRIIKDGSVSLPIVPPGVREAQLRLGKLNIDLNIRYDKQGIVLRFIEAPQKPSQSQLRLDDR
jgi:predicted house-cleaning noncanonical NTP pyrophosphatase (MazG superfamily)